MIKAEDGRVTIHGSGPEIGAETTMVLLSLYKEDAELFKDVIQHVSEFIESGVAQDMGRRVPYEPNEFSADR